MNFSSTRRAWFALLLAVLTVGGAGGFYFTKRPQVPGDVVKVECQWYEHHVMVSGVTTDRGKIDRVVAVMKQGRLYFPVLSKRPLRGVIKITDKSGQVWEWTMYIGDSLSETQWSFQYGSELEDVLRDTVPPGE